MTEVIEAPYVSAVLVPAMQARSGSGVRVATSAPNPLPDQLVLVMAMGPSGRDEALVLGWRSVVVQCWATSELVAGRLAEREFAVLKSLARDPSVPEVRKVSVWSAPVRFDDPDVTPVRPRFQFGAAILLRARVI